MSRCLDVWMPGGRHVWMFGSLDVCLSGCLCYSFRPAGNNHKPATPIQLPQVHHIHCDKMAFVRIFGLRVVFAKTKRQLVVGAYAFENKMSRSNSRVVNKSVYFITNKTVGKSNGTS